MTRQSLYDFAGGEPAFARLARAHHELCLADPVLNHPFSHPGQHPEHIERLGMYWAEVLGGPTTFSESCGSQASVLTMHSHTGADADLGERFVACFVQAMDDAELPADPQFREAMRAYMQWATDVVMSYAPRDAVVPHHEATPRWSWDGLVG